MRIVLIMLLAGAGIWHLSGCKSASGPALFCDTACLNDTMMFKNTSHPMQPYVYISVDDCIPDSIGRGYEGVHKKVRFTALLDYPTLRLNPSKVLGYVGDTSYSYLLFNDCVTGRGFAIKMPFGSNGKLSVRSSAVNKHDPKFAVADGLMAYTDRGNIFVEDMNTGKKTMMTFGKALEINYDQIHDYIDSVNITKDRIWVRIMIDEKWVDKEKKIEW